MKLKLFALILAIIAGCATTTPCTPPRTVMERKGYEVLSCGPVKKDGEVFAYCRVVQWDGQWFTFKQVPVLPRHCPVKGETP